MGMPLPEENMPQPETWLQPEFTKKEKAEFVKSWENMPLGKKRDLMHALFPAIDFSSAISDDRFRQLIVESAKNDKDSMQDRVKPLSARPSAESQGSRSFDISQIFLTRMFCLRRFYQQLESN